NMPVTTGKARPFFQKIASAKPPSKAPLVRPRNENAAFNTKSTCRLKYAMNTSAMAQAIVEDLLNRRKKASSLRGSKCLTKSMVDTDEREVRAELTDDIAAERMATIRKP